MQEENIFFALNCSTECKYCLNEKQNNLPDLIREIYLPQTRGDKRFFIYLIYRFYITSVCFFFFFNHTVDPPFMVSEYFGYFLAWALIDYRKKNLIING